MSENVIRRVFRSRWYEHHLAQPKPPLEEEHMRRRKGWVEQHLSLTIEGWSKGLWIDKAWVTGQHHSNICITRKIGAEKREINALRWDSSETRHFISIMSPLKLLDRLVGCSGGLSLEQRKVLLFWVDEPRLYCGGQVLRKGHNTDSKQTPIE